MNQKNEKQQNTESLSRRDLEVQQSLERLREEYKKLHEQKIATDRDRENLEDQLRELRSKAERDYGTSDVEQLKQLLERRRLENERMVQEYGLHIEGIKRELEEIDKTSNSPAAS